jgi:tetratricopeptide (TPR) repeat protein
VPERFVASTTSAEPDPEIRRLQLFDAASHALGGVDAPVLVIVDDVHWVSADSSRFLHHLIERSDCRWILLTRPSDRTPAAVELLADLGRWQPTWHALEPLADDEVTELVARVAPDGDESWAPEVVDRAGGNPFFATELLRHLSTGGDRDAVPPGVQQLVTASLQRLEPDERVVAEALTVAREPVPHRALTAAVELGPAEVDAAIARLTAVGLVPDAAVDPRLTHELVIETIDATIGAGRRRQLHAALGRAFAQVGPDRCPTALAHLLHDSSSVDADELDHVAAVALHQLNACSAHHEAVALGSRYLEATDGNRPTVASLDAQIQVAVALLTAGSYGRGRVILDRIEPAVRRQGDASLSADAIIARGSVNVANPELAVQVDEARLVLDALDAGHVAKRIQLGGLIAHHLTMLGRTAEALEILDRAEDENRLDPDATMQTLILAMRMQVASGSETTPAAARQRFAELSEFAERHPGVNNDSWRRLFALDQAARDGSLEDHRAAIDALEAISDRFPRPEIRWAAAAARAGHELARGDLTSAEKLIVDAQVTGGELSVGSAMSVWVTQLFMLQYERDDLATMTPFLSALDDSSSAYQLTARALLHIEAGDIVAAREMASRMAEQDRLLHEAGAGWAALASQLGDVAFATGDRQLAANVLAELEPHAGTALSAHGFLLLGAADRTLGLALATLGELDPAIEALEVAYADDRRRGQVRWAGRAACSSATVRRQRRARGDLAAARVHDQEAARLLALPDA